MSLLIGFLIFISAVLAIELISVLLRARNPEVKRIRRELWALSSAAGKRTMSEITRQKQYSSVPWLNRFLLSAPYAFIEKFDRLLKQADSRQPLGIVLTSSIAVAVVTAYGIFSITKDGLLAFMAGAMASTIPYFYMRLKKSRRIHKIETQMPEVLDLIARAMRAGHAFAGGVQMVAAEFKDPVASEFALMLNEVNFGLSYEDALKNLSERIDSPDVKFFAISVIIQRQSGGNLAEILENISRLIRDRFKLAGRVRSLSAEGRISAYILIALPFVVFLLLLPTSPAHVNFLISDPAGRKIIAGSIFMMMLGIISIKKIITIKI